MTLTATTARAVPGDYFRGTLVDNEAVQVHWMCDHQHVSRERAEACALRELLRWQEGLAS